MLTCTPARPLAPSFPFCPVPQNSHLQDFLLALSSSAVFSLPSVLRPSSPPSFLSFFLFVYCGKIISLWVLCIFFPTTLLFSFSPLIQVFFSFVQRDFLPQTDGVVTRTASTVQVAEVEISSGRKTQWDIGFTLHSQGATPLLP